MPVIKNNHKSYTHECHKARWIIPVTSPVIENGAVVICRGRIINFGKATDILRNFSGHVKDHGESVIFPSLINTHTHLELAFLKNKLPQGRGFVEWVRKIVDILSEDMSYENKTFKKEAVYNAVSEQLSNMTEVIGDISNQPLIHEVISENMDWPLAGVCFKEIISPGPPDFTTAGLIKSIQAEERENTPCNPNIVYGFSAHAPYSVSSEALKIIKDTDRTLGLPFSIHTSESPEEREFMEHGRGPMCDFLSEKRGENAAKQSPGRSSVRFLEDLKILDKETICVHCVHLDQEEMELLAVRGATACLCPGSNRFIGTGTPPASALFKAGVNVALGTDSHASNPYLSIPVEMSILAEMAPDIDPELIFRAATINGAKALGIDSHYGSIETGKRAALAVHSAEFSNKSDVMEYLVSGMAAEIMACMKK